MKTVINHGDGTQSVIALQDGNLVTGTIQDCTPIVDHTQALHNEGMHGSSEFRHAAKLPRVAVETYCNTHQITFAEFMQDRRHIRAMCNDPDLRKFRIWPGRV